MSGSDGFLSGIDVSKWQTTTPDLTGIHYLIARAGIGTKPDAMYDTHIAAARKAGLVTGSYWYNIGSLTPSDEVNAYIAREGAVDLHVIDWEGTDGFTAAQAAEFIRLYKARTGNGIGLYASESRFLDLGQDWNWIANYTREPIKPYTLWQYGPLNGADGDNYKGTDANLRAFTLSMKGAPVGLDLIVGDIAGALDITVKTDAIRVSDGTHYVVPTAVFRRAVTAQIAPNGSAGYIVNLNGPVLHFIRASALPPAAFTADGTVIPPDTTPFTQADIDAAVAKATADGVQQGIDGEKSNIRNILGL